MMRHFVRYISLLVLMFGVCFAANGYAKPIEIQQLSYRALESNVLRVELSLSADLKQNPKSFVTKNPEVLVVDFADMKSVMDKNTYDVDTTGVQNISLVHGNNRERILVKLNSPAQYSMRIDGKKVFLDITTLGNTKSAATYHRFQQNVDKSTTAKSASYQIEHIDFKRGKQKNSGQVIVTFNKPNVKTDLEERANLINVSFLNTEVPEKLMRKLDVTDFSTPVQFVNLTHNGNKVELTVTNKGEYEQSAYQSGNKFVIDVVGKNKDKAVGNQPEYTGEKISLNFQNISVRAVLQLLSQFTGLNMVVSDKVSGDVTLHLNNVPWDQALDFILKSRGLASREMGNVMIIGPAAEITAQEQAELKAKQDLQALAPLYTQTFTVNYGKVDDYYNMLNATENSFLSPRGRVVMLKSSNKLIVEDTAEKLREIRTLLTQADKPAKQVLIEARIVFVRKTFEDELGIKWGATNTSSSSAFRGFNMDLGAGGLGGKDAAVLSFAKVVGGVQLDLELSALEAESGADIVSSPRLLTSNNVKASIEQGSKIAYNSTAPSGGTSTNLVSATLKLEVTPQITPNNKLLLDLTVTQDRPGADINGQASIDTRQVTTNILMDNGETVVLGGVYERDKTNSVERVPFLGSIPGLGALFRHEKTKDQKSELLIFLTPKIIESNDDLE
tara:strand:+ start:70263 stop:72278 length:2016 start_codon:yes stop_codon:yes gene_type:complete